MNIISAVSGNVPGNGTNVADAASKTRTAGKEAVAAKKVAKEFEALFVGMMLKSMRETVGKDKLTDGGHGEEMYRSLLDQEYATSLTEHGGVGLSAMLERQLGKPATNGVAKQGVNNHGTTSQCAKTEVTYENR